MYNALTYYNALAYYNAPAYYNALAYYNVGGSEFENAEEDHFWL
jgi:hypothetical protein